MAEILDVLFKNLSDPVLIAVFVLISGGYVGLGWLVKVLLGIIKTRDEYVKDLHECISAGLGETNKTLERVVTLIEGMIYGRSGNGIR